jgi:hypothetical protein
VSLILLLHAFATLTMTGLLWFVQIVHYPLFARVGADGSVQYEREHTQRTTWVVAPLMLTEAGTAVWLVLHPPATMPAFLPVGIGGLALVIVIWLSTFFLQVPCHRRLADRHDPDAVRRLVATNWLRTIAYTARAVMVLLLMSMILEA